MDKKKIYNYVMNSPHNTNPNILSSLLNEPTSWNDLSDKPFYEETKVVSGPLNITWDGNTEGLVSDNAGAFYKVSNLVLTDEQLKLCTITPSNNTASVDLGKNWDGALGSSVIATEDITVAYTIVSVRTEGATFSNPSLPMVLTFPEKGLYFAATLTKSLTSTEVIEHTETAVKTIDPKYLPFDIIQGAWGENIYTEGGSNLSATLGYKQYHIGSISEAIVDKTKVMFTREDGSTVCADNCNLSEGIYADINGVLCEFLRYQFKDTLETVNICRTDNEYKGYVFGRTASGNGSGMSLLAIQQWDENHCIISENNLPDSVKGGGGILIVEILDDGTSSVPYDEVYTAFMTGKEIYLNIGTDLPTLTRLNGVDEGKFVWFTLDIGEDGDFDYNRYTLSADGKVTYSYFNNRVEVAAPT